MTIDPQIPPIENINEQDFVNNCEIEITEDVVSSFDINPDDLDWETFYRIYQTRYFEKYGKYVI